MKNNNRLIYLFYFALVPVLVVIDMLLKYFTESKNYSVINNIFSIFSTHNTGGAWSIFSNHTTLLTIISAIFLLLIIIFFIFYKSKTKMFSISCSLIIAGAIGNLIDRIFFGYVRDFIKLDFINFPIFNFADICVCIGVFLLAIYFLFFEGKKKDIVNEK